MARQSSSREERRTYWTKQIELWQQSGLTQVVFCRQNNLNYKSFTNWRSYLKTALIKQSRFIPIQVKQNDKIDIELPNGIQIHLPNNFDSTALEQLLQVVMS